MTLADVSYFDVARLAAAAAFGWFLVRGLFGAVAGAARAFFSIIPADSPAGIALGKERDDDTTPPGPAASA